MHSMGLELTKLTHTRLEDNLIRHRGDRSMISIPVPAKDPRQLKTKENKESRIEITLCHNGKYSSGTQ